MATGRKVKYVFPHEFVKAYAAHLKRSGKGSFKNLGKIRNAGVKVKAIFSSFKDVKVIQFSSMQDAFAGFSDKHNYARCSNPASPFCTGVTLAKLAAVTMDEQGNETFDTSGVLDKLRKGESFYNPHIPGVIKQLIVKSDGGYNYERKTSSSGSTYGSQFLRSKGKKKERGFVGMLTIAKPILFSGEFRRKLRRG